MHKNERFQVMDTTKLQELSILPVESITGITIFVRKKPPCQFCNEAKRLIETNFRKVPVETINISTTEGQTGWTNLRKEIPSIRGVPQTFFTYDIDGEQRRIYVGDLRELENLCTERENRLESLKSTLE